jgi:hypothetical protein
MSCEPLGLCSSSPCTGIVSVMETRLPQRPAANAIDPASTPAEDLPGLYRTILDRVAELEGIDERSEAARIRMTATSVYSGAWDENGRGRLIALIVRAERAIAARHEPRGWAKRRRSAPAR